jgi:HEAT repeat protein
VPGLYAAGDLACVPHNYMIGAFVYGDLAGTHAASTLAEVAAPQALPAEQIAEAHELIYRPLRHPDGPPQPQVEYKLRRFVNDYLAPPKTATKLSIAVQTFERMRNEVDGIGATTPHELLRAVEVSFIRDCAEMAARSSLTRDESRWGLYHDRSDTPDRNDVDWRYHLNLRKTADGDMEFLKRPIAPYFVSVPGLDELPSGETEPILVRQPDLVGGQAPASEVSRIEAVAAPPPSPRIAAVLALDEPTVDDLQPYLSDVDPGVRRTAVDVLTEHLCDGYAPALVAALADASAEVRLVAADGIRELVEVLPDPVAVQPLLGSDDPIVRGAAVYVVSSRRAGEAAQYRRALADADHRVRIEAVRALVSVDDVDGVAAAHADTNREVRIAVANGLGTLGAGAETVRRLIDDVDPLVRAAALAAIGAIGWDVTDAKTVERALGASAWQIRQGAARALAGAPSPTAAVPPLSRALSDPHLDVRKAAVLSLTRWASSEDAAREALSGALDDGDADVRAYARQALAAN